MSGNDTNLLRVDGDVAESGPVVERGAEIKANPIAEKGQAIDEAAEHVSPADRAPKRPRVDVEASGSKPSSQILFAHSEHLHEISQCFLCFSFILFFAKYFVLVGSSVVFAKSVALAWRDLEKERDRLRELQRKMMQDLQISQSRVATRAAMMKTANEEINAFQGELSKSQESYALLSNENGRLVRELSKAMEEVEELKKDALDLCAYVVMS